MIDANNTESGKANGTKLGILKIKNFKIKETSKSLPANSPINNQMDCRIKIRNSITNTVVKVVTNVFRMYLSSIFNAS